MEIINRYIEMLSRLKRGNNPVMGIAPHKPILLLTLIDLIENGHIIENKVSIDMDLVGTFKENWLLLVRSGHTPDFTQPFYHLQKDKIDGESIWHIKPIPGHVIDGPVKSINRLNVLVEYGYFKADLFILLTSPVSRSKIKLELLNFYFKDTKANYLKEKSDGTGYLHDVENDLINRKQIRPEARSEEENFVRGGIFKKWVPIFYGHSCCITGMKLESSFGHSFIDACHIIPFSRTQDDHIVNGIALCPNLHRAFDRGLVSIRSDYTIMISSHVIEEVAHPYNIVKYKGKRIRLPGDPKHNPSHENLEWHNENIFKN